MVLLLGWSMHILLAHVCALLVVFWVCLQFVVLFSL